MHIALKKIKFDLIRFLPKGSDEQIEDIYNIVKDAYFKTESSKKELDEMLSKLEEKSPTEIDDIYNGKTVKKTGRPKKQEIK